MNTDKKLPVLDLKVWLKTGSQSEKIIRHHFYEKDMTSQLVIHKDSAIGWGVKRAALVNEVKRRLYNTDNLTPCTRGVNKLA